MTKTSASLFRGLPTRASAKRKRKCYVEILARIHDQLFSLMTHHSRITVFRVDLRFPDGERLGHTKEGQLLSAYIESVKAKLGSLGVCQNSKVIHGAAKEIGTTKGKPHFHVFFGFNSKNRDLGEINATGHTDLWQFVNQKWVSLANGTTHIVAKVHRFDWFEKEKLGLCFKHLSYLAKTESKDYGTGEHHKRFTASRLQPNPNVPAIAGCQGACGEGVRCRRCAVGFAAILSNGQVPAIDVDADDESLWDEDKDEICEPSHSRYLSAHDPYQPYSISEAILFEMEYEDKQRALGLPVDNEPPVSDFPLALGKELSLEFDELLASLEPDDQVSLDEFLPGFPTDDTDHISEFEKWFNQSSDVDGLAELGESLRDMDVNWTSD